MEATHLELMHATPLRLRLRHPREMPAEKLVSLIDALALQPWVRGLHHRVASASLVIELASGVSPLRWQLGLAELDCTLLDRRWAESAQDSSWERMVRQIGGNIIGATLGQVVIGGSAGLLGAWLLGARAGVILGACGALVGSVVGSVAGGELADGESAWRQGDLGAVTLRKLGGRLGEEAGWSTGTVIGAALAGPAGAVAGRTIGSIVAGQAVEDLIRNHGQARGVGRLSWLVRLGEDQSGERATESLMGGLGRGLSGGQDWGARLGSRLGASVGHKIDWAGSLRHHQLMNRISSHPARPAT